MKQPKCTTKKTRRSAFSTLELVASIAVIGILAAIALPLVNKTSQASRESKLTNEVASINRAIQIYKSSGGSLNGITAPQAVIDSLKTSRTEQSAKNYVGYTGSMMDARVRCDYGNAGEGQLCAVYNSDTQQFELTRGASDCVLQFDLNGAGGVTLEDRATSVVEYGEEGWIWDYDDQDPSSVAGNAGGNSGINSGASFPQTVSSQNETPTSGQTFVGSVNPATAPTDNSNDGYTGPGVGSDGITSIVPCDVPQFLLIPGAYPKDQFPLACPIINPNGSNGSVYYMIEGKDEDFKPYNSNFFCETGDRVIAYCKSNNEFYTDSQTVECVYTADNAAPECVNDNFTINIIYNTHKFAGNESYNIGDTDEGTSFDSGLTETTCEPLTNDSDPDGDSLDICSIIANTNQLPIEAVTNDDGTITFIPTAEAGLLGYRRSIYFDQESYRNGEVITSDVNDSYNEFWADIASIYNWKNSSAADDLGDRTNEDGTFTAVDTYTYTICDGFGGEDNGEIECRVQELTVLSPIAIDTDGSGAIELTTGVQSFDFTGNGSNETVKGWFAGNDGILVDANYGDTINGEHLFGDMGGKHSDGFAKLSLRDEDKNGVIAGSEMADLKLWFDNGNAKLDAGELRSMEDFGINEISLQHTDYVSEATTTEGAKLHVEDIWFPVHK